MDVPAIEGWYHIRKFIPLDCLVNFRQTKKRGIDKIAPIGRNTCPILTSSGFPESLGLSASFTYGQLANQGMGSHPKIHPTGLVGDFYAAALLSQRRSSRCTILKSIDTIRSAWFFCFFYIWTSRRLRDGITSKNSSPWIGQ